MAVFSIRHRRALRAGDFKVEFDERLRGRLWRVLVRLNLTWGDVSESNWHYETSVLDEITPRLLDAYGFDELRVDDQKATIEVFVRSATGPLVCDVLECFVEHEEAPEGSAVQLNEVFEQEETPWRLLERRVVKLDSGLLATMLKESHRLTNTGRVHRTVS